MHSAVNQLLRPFMIVLLLLPRTFLRCLLASASPRVRLFRVGWPLWMSMWWRPCVRSFCRICLNAPPPLRLQAGYGIGEVSRMWSSMWMEPDKLPAHEPYPTFPPSPHLNPVFIG